MTNKVLVTGAAGFIGSHLVETLVHLGYDVRAFVRYNSDRCIGQLAQCSADVLDEIEIYFGDIRDAEAVYKATKGVDTIYHLAAVISIPYSYQHPEETVAVNVGGSLNILQVAGQRENTKVIVTSTSEVYGTARYSPIDEKHPRQAQSPYAASKISADALAESYFNSFDTPIVIVRPFNTFGPRQSMRAIIPTIITQALICDTVQLGALHPTRDFTYVTDTVQGLIKAAQTEAVVGDNINLGTGQSISIGSLAQKIIQMIGCSAVIQSDAQRLRPEKSEVIELVSNNTKAQHLIGWQPKFTLEEGLQQTIGWIQEHKGSFTPDDYVI